MISVFLISLAIWVVFFLIAAKVNKRLSTLGNVLFYLASFVLFILYGYYFEASEYGRVNRQRELIITLVIVYSLPIFITGCIVKLVDRHCSNLSYFIGAVLAALISLVWPFFSLVTSCEIGSDCI